MGDLRRAGPRYGPVTFVITGLFGKVSGDVALLGSLARRA